MRDMKTISISKRSRFRMLHVEAPGCIVNVHFGLHDASGREVTTVSVNPDQYAGEPAWNCNLASAFDGIDPKNYQRGIGVRVVREA
jgi:hypothetical protein